MLAAARWTVAREVAEQEPEGRTLRLVGPRSVFRFGIESAPVQPRRFYRRAVAVSTEFYRHSVVKDGGSTLAAERLSQVLANSSLRKVAFARQIDISPQNLNGILHGEHGITVAVAERIARAFGVSAGWLLFGEQAAAEPGVAEGGSVYGRPVRLLGVNCEAAEVPVGTMVYRVEGDGLEPAWRAGQRLMVVKAERGEKGPGIVRHGRRAWRIFGEIY